MHIALVHDYLREYGGAERVLEALHELYPNAPVYTAFVDKNALGRHWSRFSNWDLRQTGLAQLPLHTRLFSPLRILAPRYFRQLDLSAYDVVISSSNAYFAKAVRVPGGVHVCYCHTPSRSLYGYTTLTDWKKNPIIRVGGTLLNHYLRVEDVKIAQAVDYFIANSHETARRIKKFYRKEATVIYPPVAIQADAPLTATKRDYFLYVNRLALAKHPELAIAACTKLKLPLKVVGEGKLRPELEAKAGPTVEFLGAVSDAELRQLYAGARALLYPVEDEDFGIVPVEAMGHGVPVIAHRSGGPQETIVEGKTGTFFDDLNEAGLISAIQTFSKRKFSLTAIQRHARQFSSENFKKNIQAFVSKVAKKSSH